MSTMSEKKRYGGQKSRPYNALAILFSTIIFCCVLLYMNANKKTIQAVQVSSDFDFSTKEGNKKALETYIYLHNKLGSKKWLPLDMDFGYSRGYSIVRHAVEKVFFPMLIEKGWAQGPTCLDWSTRYIGSTFKDFCTDQYAIFYERDQCGGQFGAFTEGRKGYCADIHKTQGIVPDDKFDMVLSTMVFEHLTNPWVAAFNVYNMIKPGGVLIWIAPQISIFHEFPNHYYGFTVQGAVLMLQQAGFCIQWAHGLTSSFTCASHILGMSHQDLNITEYDTTDDIAPCLVGVVARKPLEKGAVCPKGDFPSVGELGSFRANWGKRVKAESQG